MTYDSCGDNAVQGVIYPVREDDATGQMIGDVLGITKLGCGETFRDRTPSDMGERKKAPRLR